MGDETPFILRPPFRPEQRDAAIAQSMAGINRDIGVINSHGYDEFSRRRDGQASAGTNAEKDDDDATDDNLGSSFEGELRAYQIYMLERARTQNVVVHLGTGMGKTLISIFLIRDFLFRRNKNPMAVVGSPSEQDGAVKSHILFLVPSIALAVQHTDTLKANLPCVVATACHTSSHSLQARDEISNADVIVATHGTALDLLRHYPDVLSMSKVKLMVMDECHYATGKHNYATILKDYYHPLSLEERPRVLGLTASPLINVKVHANELQMQRLLSNFESIMDAQLLGFPLVEDPGGGTGRKGLAEEAVVEYNSLLDRFDTTLPEFYSLHASREKEIAQLQYLCKEVGFQVTAVYASTLAAEVSRNEFERERPQQFENLKCYLLSVTDRLNHLIDEGLAGDAGGHTHKMKNLEEMLMSVVEPRGLSDSSDGQTPVGIVFVERRITAIALYAYFCHRRKRHRRSETSRSHYPIRCDIVVRQATNCIENIVYERYQDRSTICRHVTTLPLGKRPRSSSI
ncbi:hypothetical protein ACHAWF_012981 [Thalassiosira exigua]